jgi:superfamily I DNA/RNA helicase
MLQRDDPTSWTASDLPLLDAARRAVGDPDAGRIRRERERLRAAEREYRADVADYLMAASDDDLGLMSMLRGEDVLNSLDDDDALPTFAHDALTGPFAHIIVDEAQELTDAEWRMLLSRCPSRSFTVVGDRAQARHGFAQTWEDRLTEAGLRDVRLASLSVNYRTPEEIMAEAEPVIRAALPDANVPTSVRSSGIPVRHGAVAQLDAIVDTWLAGNDEGTGVVIGDESFAGSERVRSLTPEAAKGLEFDLVVLVGAASFGEGIEGAVDRYVAMTRSTRELVVLE